MKSDRRHELHQNMLAKALSDLGQWIKKYANYLAGGLLVAALVVFLVVTLQTRSTREKQDIAAKYQDLSRKIGETNNDQTLKQLSELGRQAKDPQVAARANMDVGNAYAYRIVTVTDLSEADRNTFVEEAKKHYQRLDEYPQFAQLRAQAHIGLARLAEVQRDFDQAQQEYDKAAQLAPKGTYDLVLAQQGLEGLKELRAAKPTTFAATAPATKPAAQASPATGPAAVPATGATSEPATGPSAGAEHPQPTRRPATSPGK